MDQGGRGHCSADHSLETTLIGKAPGWGTAPALGLRNLMCVPRAMRNPSVRQIVQSIVAMLAAIPMTCWHNNFLMEIPIADYGLTAKYKQI